ncbi:MAG: aldo/keto reductase [Streptosporangiaceae bacterium]
MTTPGEVPSVALPGGRQLPLVGFGTWKLRGRAAHDAVVAALAAGYRHLDTATMYGNEAEVGQALRDSGIDRAEVFLTTKIRPSDGGRAGAVLQASLRALGTDYLDLWLVHWPPARIADNRQLWHELVAFQAAGQVRDIGVSNYDLDQLDDLKAASGRAPSVNQVHWSPARFDPAILAGHQRRGVTLEGYSPLRDTNLDDPALTKIAAAHGVTAAQVVLRWHLEHGIPVIPKSSQPDRVRANFDLFGFRLSPAEVASIDALGR